MKKFIATSCELMLHEDDWIEGEGDLIARWNEDLSEADTIADVLRSIPYLDKNYGDFERVQDVFDHDPCYDDEPNRFDADLTVDIETDCYSDGGFRIIKPTEEKWKKFEKGEVKLYALHVIVHIQKLGGLDIDDIGAEGWCR